MVGILQTKQLQRLLQHGKQQATRCHHQQPAPAARDVVPLPNERGWICKHPKYGTWFMPWAAVVKDLKQFDECPNEPSEKMLKRGGVALDAYRMADAMLIARNIER